MNPNTTYQGCEAYPIDCTGDVVVGDEVCFDQATFSGSFRRATFAGYERVCGQVLRESYGLHKQQHTFTLRLDDGRTRRIKGRNLYAHGVWRKPWPGEDERAFALTEKHARGDRAREARRMRKEFEHVVGF